MLPILLSSRISLSYFLSRIFLLCSSFVLLDQISPIQAQIISNGAGTVVNPQGNQINITGGTQAGANLFRECKIDCIKGDSYQI